MNGKAGKNPLAEVASNVVDGLAGEIIPRLTGLGWESFVQERIMQPVPQK